MQFTRLTAAVALSSALVVTACTGDEPAPQGASSAPAATTDASSAPDGTATAGDAATSTGDAATSTGDAARSTGEAGDATSGTADSASAPDDASSTTVPMTTDEGEAVLSVEEAEQVATTVLRARLAALKADGAKARAARGDAFSGSLRQAAQAADRLESVTGRPAEARAKRPAPPNVLAISRDDGRRAQLLLVQTVRRDEAPVLHLLESSTGDQEDFRIIWEASMLPGTELPSFDRRSVGTPVVRKGPGDLTVSPRDALRGLAAHVSWPRPDDLAEYPEYRTHGYSPAVRRAARAQADAVAGQATLRERNRLLTEDVRTLLFEDGSAFVVGTLMRETTFTVKPNSVLTPPETFLVFDEDPELTNGALLRTMVFAGLRVPAEDGDQFKPEVIAAQEQLLNAAGS